MNNKFWIFGGAAVLLVIIIVIIFSCRGKNNSGTGGPVTLKYWRVNESEDVFKPIFESFNETNPNIKIDYTKKDLAEYYNNLLDALAGSNGPDVFAIRNDWLPAFKDKIDVVPNDIYTQEEFKNTFVDAANDELIDGTNIYGIPLSVDTLSLIYNDQMLADARCTVSPKNWNDFIICSKKLTKLSGNRVIRAGCALGTANNLDTSAAASKKLATDILSAMMIQSGTEMVSADKSSASFGLPATSAGGKNVYPGTNALDFYTSFARTRKETYTWHSRMPNAIKAFADQEVGMIFGYSDMIKTIQAKNPGLTIYSAPLPQIKDSDNPKTIASYWVEVVAKQSKYRAESWKLLKYLSQTNGIVKYSAATNRPPSRKDMVESASSTPQYGAFASQLSYAANWYRGKEPEKVYTIFANMISGVLSGQKLQNTIDAARNATTALLQAQK